MVEVDDLAPPKTYDEALAFRAKLIAEVDRIQDSLSLAQSPPFRKKLLDELSKNRALLRQTKEWLRKNDVLKMSEWTLLARVHGLLSRIGDDIRVGEDPQGNLEEMESLLDAIELVVPGQYLDKGEKK